MEANKDTLKIIISDNVKVLVFFYKESCGVCKILKSKISETNLNQSNISIAIVNADTNPELNSIFGISGYPFIVTFHNKSIVESISTSFYTRIEKMANNLLSM